MSIFKNTYNAAKTYILNLFWPNDSLKRRRDSVDEDEEDDILNGCETLSKRRKWMNTPKMASNNDVQNSSSQKKSYTLQKRFQQNLENAAAKENASDIEVIEVAHVHSSIDTRAPLSNLSVKPKTKKDLVDVSYSLNGIRPLNQHALKSNGHNPDRRKNGIHQLMCPQNSFTSSMRFHKHSTSRHTALNETLKADDHRIYSALIANYQKAKVGNSKPQDNHSSEKSWGLVSSIKPMASSSFCKPVNCPPPKQEIRKSIRVPVKAWQSSASDDDIEIVEEMCVPPVNSLEKKLSQNELVSAQWVLDMKKRYEEKERETRRRVKEAELKKALYAKSNHDRYTEALAERIKKHIQITEVVLDDVEEAKLPELTEEINRKIDSALKPNPPNEVLVEGFGQLVRRQDIKTLHHLNWLNDEVINFYMNLIVERGKEGRNPPVYAFNTFFYPKLVSQGYSSLRRWTKKVDIFTHELLLVPIHLGMHWCMAAIDFRDSSVRYYDSMGSENDRCLNALLKYLNEESLDKKKKVYDTSSWKMENVKDIPQQMNGSDCGMFSCMFAEYLSRNAKFTFSQKDMPYFRRKMVYEIISKRLLQ